MTITLASTTGLPGSFPFTLALDFGQVNEELVEVTALGGLTATITRAIDGTSATTHNGGAVVRHVSSARDFADSRNHENSTAGVHGLAMGSSLVGSTDVQTLSNKTLASPAVTGTMSGNITFSGNETYTGTSTYTNSPAVFQATAPTTAVVFARMIGDANSRTAISANGTYLWSDGTAVADTNLYRASPSVLATDDKFRTLQGLDIQTAAADSINFKASTNASGAIAMRLRDSINTSVLTVADTGDVATSGSVTALSAALSGPVTVGGVDQGRGFQQFKTIAQVTMTNTNETLIATTNSAINFLNGRAYKVSIWGYAASSGGAGDYLYLRVRKGAGTAGTIYLDQMRVPTLGAVILNVPVSLGPIVRNVSGATISTSLSLTAQSQTATGGNPAQWSSNGGSVSSYLYVEDIGMASDYQGFNLT